MENIEGFLIKNKYQDLLMNYRNSKIEIQVMLENAYKVAFRFNLTKSQTKYLLEEIIRPFENEISLV